MSARPLGLGLLGADLLFIGWVTSLAFPFRPEGPSLGLRIQPETPSPVRRVPAHEPGPARVLEVRDRRVLADTDSGRRAFGTGELLPDGRLVVGFEGETARLFDGAQIVVGSTDDQGWTAVEDFELPPPLSPELPPLSEALQAAALDTFDSIIVDPGSAQLAVDALLDAGEVIAPVLGRRLGGRTLCVAQFVLPDGRVVAPPDDGVLVLVLLEALTGRRYGDVSSLEDPIERAEIEATWAGMLGVQLGPQSSR
ncbi:MAG: hypothetical protein AAGD10_18545 [Myxococcota bacterium]